MCKSTSTSFFYPPPVPSEQADAAACGKGRGGCGDYIEQGLKDFPYQPLVADEPVDEFFHTRFCLVFVCADERSCVSGGGGPLPRGYGGGSAFS